MGEWSKFIKGLGEIAVEFSKAREESLLAQNQNLAHTQAEYQSSSRSPQSNQLYPDLNSIGRDFESPSAPTLDVDQKVTPELSTRDRRRRDQQREDDEEDWEVLRDRRRVQHPPAAAPAPAPNNGNGATFAILGAAALGVGAYAAYKSYFGSDDEKPTSFVTTQAECVKTLKKIKEDTDEYPVVGMDCQWLINTSPYDPRNPVALLQLATHKGKTLIIPLKKFSSLPQELRSLLNNSEIIKTGIENIKDARFLREDYGIEVQSTFDLRFLAEATAHRPVGLEGLAKDVLDLDIGSGWDIISSDWEKWPLDSNQIAYAETAVKASIDIFTTLYPFTGSPETKRDILNYCSLKKDRPFIWDSRKWGTQA